MLPLMPVLSRIFCAVAPEAQSRVTATAAVLINLFKG